MKPWEVVISPAPEAEALEAFQFIFADSPENAQRWLNQLYQAIEGLEDFRGYAVARENDWLGGDLRQKVFKSHRIVYALNKRERRVYVHYVRHGARRSGGEAG